MPSRVDKITTPLTDPVGYLVSLTERLEAAEKRLVALLPPPRPALKVVQPCPDEPLGGQTD